MPIRTGIALAAVAFLGFASVASAAEDSKRQLYGYSFHVGPLGQYFGSRAPLPGYYTYGYGPYGYVHRYHRTGRDYPYH
jgi:hypothetical protein